MTEDHPATCKFCRIPVTLKIDPDALGMFNVETWKAMAACNRCADYHTARLATSRSIYDTAMRHLRASQAEDSERMAKHRNRLTEQTRKLATLASKHYKVGFTWEADWVTQLIDQPENAFKACSWYERQMLKANLPHRQTQT